MMMREISGNAPRRLKRREMDELVALYRRAFWDDPVIDFILPDEQHRARTMDAYMRMQIRYGFRYGRVLTIAEEGRLRVGSVWLPPGQAPPHLWGMVRSGFIQLLLTEPNVPTLRKFFALSAAIEKLHKKDIPKQHWYLMVLAVDPPNQGQGLGGAVLEQELREADMRGLPCYVETAKPINVTFYEKQGFVVNKEIAVPMGGPPFWTLIREPVR
jgi:ribosomal protein S18 acetylase RimI-like enzyme